MGPGLPERSPARHPPANLVTVVRELPVPRVKACSPSAWQDQCRTLGRVHVASGIGAISTELVMVLQYAKTFIDCALKVCERPIEKPVFARMHPARELLHKRPRRGLILDTALPAC
jgi:hypothetical protein